MSEHRNRDPTWAEIERAWVKPRPQPVDVPPGYVRSVYGFQRIIHWISKITLVLWFVAVGLMTAAAAVDVLAGLGWGYKARDVGFGLLMTAFGGLVALFYWAITSLVGAMTQTIYGLEPGKAQPTHVAPPPPQG